MVRVTDLTVKIRQIILVLDDAGVVVKGVSGRTKGDKVSLMFPDGTLNCIVDDIK